MRCNWVMPNFDHTLTPRRECCECLLDEHADGEHLVRLPDGRYLFWSPDDECDCWEESDDEDCECFTWREATIAEAALALGGKLQ